LKGLKLVAVDELHYYHDMLGRYAAIDLSDLLMTDITGVAMLLS
jgi:hypothetical protein